MPNHLPRALKFDCWKWEFDPVQNKEHCSQQLGLCADMCKVDIRGYIELAVTAGRRPYNQRRYGKRAYHVLPSITSGKIQPTWDPGIW